MNVNEFERISGSTFLHICTFSEEKVDAIVAEPLGEGISDSLKRQIYCLFPTFYFKMGLMQPYLVKELKNWMQRAN